MKNMYYEISEDNLRWIEDQIVLRKMLEDVFYQVVAGITSNIANQLWDSTVLEIEGQAYRQVKHEIYL